MLNFPGWVLVNINPIVSSILSELSFGLMILYFVISKQWSLNIWMLLLGALFFGIGSLTDQAYTPETLTYLIIIVKFFIIVIGGNAIVKDTTKIELFLFLIIGAGSVFIQMFLFYNPLTDGGRYSGFYLNPNSLGFICMMGYGLTYGLDKKWRIWGQIVFTLVGFLTFSRTFIVVWLFMNLLSIRLSLKNLRILAVGFGLLVALITFNSLLPKSNPRLEAMSNILEGTSDNTSKLEEGGRTETWAIFYDALMEKPLLGHGYDSFAGGGKIAPLGPHNSFIKTWGEGGLLPLLVMLSLYLMILQKSWFNFLLQPHLFLMSIGLFLFMLTNHSYWTNGYMLFFSMWLQHQISYNYNTKSNYKLE